MDTVFETIVSPLGIQHVVKDKPYRGKDGSRKRGWFLCELTFVGGRYIEVNMETSLSGICPKCAKILKREIEEEQNRQRLQEEQEIAAAELAS